MFNNGLISHKKLGRISFNTAFLDYSQDEIIFNVEEIDPDKLAKKKGIQKDFQIHVKFTKYCCCDNRTKPVKICDQCEDFLKHENKEWKEIQEILKIYKNDLQKSKKLLFKYPEIDDVETVLKFRDCKK